MAIPDHPWTKVTRDSAAVRIAMTVAERGKWQGVLRETITEHDLDTDNPQITFSDTIGAIDPNLTVGIDVAAAIVLRAGKGISHDGVKLHGRGFVVDASDAARLGLGDRSGAEAVHSTIPERP